MLTITDSMKEAYNQYTTQRKSYIQIGNNSFFIQNLDIQADCYDEGNVIGNAISKIAKFDIETEYVKQLDEFEIFDGIWTGEQYEYVSLGTFKLFEENGTDGFFSSITSYDKLILFNQEYDNNLVAFPTTVYGLLNAICNQAGVELYNTTIVNGAQPLESNLFVEGESLKRILKAICQISGCFAIISQDKLKLLLKNTDTLTLEKHQISQPEYKRTTWKINQVVLGMSNIEGEYVLRQDPTDVEQNGVHKLVINDNPFVYTQALREAYIDNIFNQVKGFEYVAFETKWEGLPYVELGDLLNLDGKESIVLRYNLISPKGLNSVLSAPSIIDSVIDYVDNSNSIENRQKKTEVIVNKQNQKIESVVSQTNEQNEKISQITQTVDELNSKIKDIADITITGESIYAKVDLDNINQSEPITIKVRPVGENISYDYPHNDYPQNDYSKTRTIRFTNKTTGEIFDYVLPDDLLYYDSENYDEFILEYDSHTVFIKKKVGYNADGTTYALETSTINEYDFPKIELTDGNYNVTLLGYDNAYLFVRLMAQNIYTTQFATRAEVSSEINQTAEDITLGVDKKLTNYSTTTEMNSAIAVSSNSIKSEVSNTYATKNELKNTSTTLNSKIEQTATSIKNEVNATIDGVEKEINAELELKVNTDDLVSEINVSADVINLKGNRFIVQADNFQLDKNGNMICTNAKVTGEINSTTGNIGGWTINSEGLTNGSVFIKNNGASTIYTFADMLVIRNYIMGEDTFNLDGNTNLFSHYDLNGDGVIDAIDYVRLSKLLDFDTN